MKSPKTALFFALFLALFTFSATSPGENVELEEAKQYLNEGNTKKATGILKRLVATKTLSAESHIEASELLAVAYIFDGDEEEAEDVFANLISEHKEYKYPHYQPPKQPKSNDTSWCWTHPHLAKSYLTALKKAGVSLKIEPQGPGIQTIAIIDFENNSVDDAEKLNNFGRALAKIMISDFVVFSKLQVVERERLQFLLDELELTDKKVGGKQIMDPASAPRVGKFLGAHSFIFGSFIKLGKTFRIDARIVKTETGEIFKTASVEGKPQDILKLASELTLKITKGLNIDIEKVERKKLDEMGEDRVPLEAWALLGDAESLSDQEQYKNASKKLVQALEVAPEFQQAKDMLRVLQHLV